MVKVQSLSRASNRKLTSVHGFPRDSPRAVLERWLTELECFRSFAEQPAKVWSPFLRGSELRVEWPSPEIAGRFVTHFRTNAAPFVHAGKSYALRCNPDRTPAQRVRNRHLGVCINALQTATQPTQKDKTTEWWLLVCWRSCKIWLHNRHVATFNKREERLEWQPDTEWWDSAFYTVPAALIRQETENAI